MTISKDFRFPVSVHWQGQQLVHVEAPDVDEIVVAVPPEFRGPGAIGVLSSSSSEQRQVVTPSRSPRSRPVSYRSTR
jgi:hypothetical protein